MAEVQIDAAVLLCRDGWTLHNMGQRLGVEDQMIRRAQEGRDDGVTN